MSRLRLRPWVCFGVLLVGCEVDTGDVPDAAESTDGDVADADIADVNVGDADPTDADPTNGDPTNGDQTNDTGTSSGFRPCHSVCMNTAGLRDVTVCDWDWSSAPARVDCLRNGAERVELVVADRPCGVPCRFQAFPLIPVERESRYTAAGDLRLRITSTFDDYGNTTQTVQEAMGVSDPYTVQSEARPPSRPAEYEIVFDVDGTVGDPWTQLWLIDYRPDGQVEDIHFDEPDSSTWWELDYDGSNRPATLIVHSTSGPFDQYIYTYDAQGRVATAENLPFNTLYTYEYDCP